MNKKWTSELSQPSANNIIVGTAAMPFDEYNKSWVEINDKDYSDEELDESEYTIIRCPEAGILDEETGEVFHTKYVAYPEATYGDGEAEPLTDPKL